MADQETPVPSDTAADRRKALEDAFADVEDKPEVTETTETETEEPDTPEQSDDADETDTREPDEQEEQPEQKAASESDEVEKPAEGKDDKPEPVKKDEPASRESIAKAPQSWKPEAREAWSAMPDSAKREIVRREREMATTLQKSADERKLASEINSVVAPYEAELRAAGASAPVAIKDLLNTSYVLRRGSPADRAKMTAAIIQQHGIDLTMLNDLLMGATPEKANDPTAKRLEQLEAQEARRQQEAQQQGNQTVNQEIAAFRAKHEFFDDVQTMMGTLIKENQAEGLQDAYDQAIWANKETRRVIQQRKAKQAPDRLAAASSIKGNGPKGAVAGAAPVYKDRMSALSAAWDTNTGKAGRF